MPATVQKSTLAARLGQQIAAAHDQTKDKPVDTGFTWLPPGIRNGVAELRGAGFFAYTPSQKSYEAYKGEEYFRAFGVALLPEEHEGVPVAGAQTTFMVPMHGTPAKGQKKETTFLENYDAMQNWFKMFGVQPPNVAHLQPAQRGVAIMDYYTAAANALVTKNPKPQFKFSTRGWTPPPTPQNPKPDVMVFEEWHGRVEHPVSTGAAAAAGVRDRTLAPEPFTEPPQAAPLPVFTPAQDADIPFDPADAIQTAVLLAEEDKNGDTPEGASAIKQLKEAAVAAGFSEQQVEAAESWTDVGNMALGIAPEKAAPAAPPAPLATPAVGVRFKYLRRDSKGNVLHNPRNKAPFPHLDVELVTVDATARTCTAKTVADGKTVVGLGKGAGPVQIKFEWLE